MIGKKITNMIGLEAEAFLMKGDEVVFPEEYGFDHDDFPILLEMRAAPASTRQEVLANFYKVYYDVKFRTEKEGLSLVLPSTGFRDVTPALYSKIVRQMGVKTVNKSKNIHNIDIQEFSDTEVGPDGKIVAQRVSNGLHIHFSSVVLVEKSFKYKTRNFEMVDIPIVIGKGASAKLDLYTVDKEQETEVKIEASASRITMPVLQYIVEQMDTQVLAKFPSKVPLRYRQPGFYEVKSDGRFEYRSLPFTPDVLNCLPEIVDIAFTFLEDLELE